MTLTIGIITRYRPNHLKLCLDSIAKQTSLPTRIIIVLHPHDQRSIALLKKYKKILKIETSFYSKKGYATQRNMLLHHNRSEILYMVDDDCVMHKNNIKNISKIFKSHPHTSAVQGKATNKDTSFYSQFMQWTYNLWIKRLSFDQNQLRSLDTKNIAFRVEEINNKKNIKFNECFGSEDVDFGLQLASHNLSILYSRNIPVIHHESTQTFPQFIHKKIRMKKGISFIKRKWGANKIYVFDPQDYQYLTNKFKQSTYSNQWIYRIIFVFLSSIRSIECYKDRYRF